MAFLCPVRIRRGKKKKSSSGPVEAAQSPSSTFSGLGRITGSSSIETLVRVGLEKENGLSSDSKMVLLHDFTPCVDDELLVKKGQIVNILYRENDWVYVISEDSRLEGFIPLSYCTPYNSHLGELALHNFKKKLPRDQSSNSCINVDIHKSYTSDSEKSIKKELNQNQLQQHGSPNNSLGSTSQADMNHFLKDPSGRFIVLYSFVARDENDVSVERGDFVTVLNREDPDWFWIVRSDGHEGFVPSGFVYPADVLQKMTSNMASTSNNTTATNSSSNPITNNVLANPTPSNFHEEVRFHGSELVMLYDYKAQASDDLSIRRGDWIYADLNNQKVDGWLWGYAPKTKKYGFVPKVYARPPATTIQRHTKT